MRWALWIMGLVGVATFALLLRTEAIAPGTASTSERAATTPAPGRHETTATNVAPRERVPALDPDVVVAGTRVVRVVATLPTGEPAAGATVRYHAFLATGLARAPDDDEGKDLEVELAAGGQEAVTDERGHVAIAVAADTTLCVRRAEHYGEARVGGNASEVRVALQRDATLRVQVLDADGRPRERFCVEGLVQTESRRVGDWEDKLRLPLTDATGMAVTPHAQLALTMPGPDVVVWRMVLRCEVGAVERVVTAAEFLAEQPFLLRVPAGGAIAVEITGAGGGWVWADATLSDAVSGEQRDDDDDEDLIWFRQLSLGRRWVLTVSSFENEVRREIIGPTRIDEVVRTRVELALRAIELNGRIVRSDGVPVPRADIRFRGASVRFWHDNKTESRDGSVGGRIGDFSFGGVLPAEMETVSGATLHLERESYCVPTTIDLAPLRPGANDLGDVVVPVPPDEILLASVEMRVAGRNVTADAWAWLQGAGDQGINTVTSIRIPRGDRIDFRGPPTSRPLEVSADLAGHFRRTVAVRRGGHAVVDLEPASSLAVRVLSPPVPWRSWTAEMMEADQHYPGSRTDDGFEWDRVVPGRYTLRFLVEGRCVHEVNALDVRSGANVWPHDGIALDLRRSAEAFHLEIRAADGGEVDDRWVCYVVQVDRGAPPEDLQPSSLRSSSQRWFVTRPQPVELVFTARGFVPVCIPGPTADTEVRLARRTKLRVHTVPGDGVRTIVRIVEDGVRDPWLRALDTQNLQELNSPAEDEPVDLAFAPGTIVEVVVERDGVPGTPQRVAIGSDTVEIHAR